MESTVYQVLAPVASSTDKQAMALLFENIASRLNSAATATAGLVINGASNAAARTGGTIFYATVGGRHVAIAASTVMPALTGLSIAANTFNIACFFINAAGTVTVRFGRQGATAAAVVFPDFPLNQALVGYLLITHSSAFTGGTTALDTATTVFVSPVGAFDPTLYVN